jgi:hypothetical protein
MERERRGPVEAVREWLEVLAGILAPSPPQPAVVVVPREPRFTGRRPGGHGGIYRPLKG